MGEDGRLAQPLTVRELGPEDWTLKRELRLAALRDAPAAFGSTYEQAARRDEQEWRAWPRGGAAVFGAWTDAGAAPVGIAGADEAGAAGLGYLFAMWVAPAVRGRGVAGVLIDAVCDWTRRRGLAGVLLEVAAGNDAALSAYRRYGFEVSDDPTHTECGTSMRLMFQA